MNNTTIINNLQFQIEPLIETIITYCKESYTKIKSAIKAVNYDFLNDVNTKIKSILEILFENEDILQQELECFVQIKPYIIYIIGKNCENNQFGFIECCLNLINMFKRLIKAKFEYLNDETKLNDYITLLNKYPKELYDFRMFFNENIFINTSEFNQEIEKLDVKLRGE